MDTIVIVYTLELFNTSNTQGSCLSSFMCFQRDSKPKNWSWSQGEKVQSTVNPRSNGTLEAA